MKNPATIQPRWLSSAAFVLAASIAAVAIAPTWFGAPGVETAMLGLAFLLAMFSAIVVTFSSSDVEAARILAIGQQGRITGLEARLVELTSSQGRFVGNIAHEIKTPLAIMISELDVLRRGDRDPSSFDDCARHLSEDLQHLSDLVEGLLKLARPFARIDASQHVPVDVHDCVLEANRRTRLTARRSEVAIVSTLAEPTDAIPSVEVMGDPVLLEAMLENLLRNAVRFSAPGSDVELQVTASEACVLVQIRDRGLGIPAEHLESVFDWSFQVPGVPQQSSGTGFGLAIARLIVQHHGGTITVQNQPEGGCRFEITLPRHAATIDDVVDDTRTSPNCGVNLVPAPPAPRET